MKIIIYDDHKLVTDAISRYLEIKDTGIICWKCHTIDEVKTTLKTHTPDIAISDVLSDEDAGLTLFEHIIDNYPTVRIVIYSSISNPFVIQELKNMGISKVINKRESPDILWQAVQDAFNSTTSSAETIKHPRYSLTPREKEVVLLLAKGLASKEIAFIMGTSPHTVNNQKAHLLNKFDCNNTTDLVIKLSQLGLISVI
jgi:DNA-binding NarL/FixJ family response regulator